MPCICFIVTTPLCARFVVFFVVLVCSGEIKYGLTNTIQTSPIREKAKYSLIHQSDGDLLDADFR